MSDVPSPWPFRSWALAIILLTVVLVTVASLTDTAGRIFGLAVNREAVEQSQQYAATNTAAFYDAVNSIKKIDVQLSALPEGSPSRQPLLDQRAFLENEATRYVALIPHSSRTPDMASYGGSR